MAESTTAQDSARAGSAGRGAREPGAGRRGQRPPADRSGPQAKRVRSDTTTTRNMGEKLFNDCVHGHFILPQLCVKIIDTDIFQRLRNIKQLGVGYFLYPGAAHNRFEHSLGVCYLAGEIVDALNRNTSKEELKISEEEKLCLQVAGLCHDLGHGPFSHVWEEFVHRAHGNNEWKHEDMSVALFKLVLQNERVQEEFKSCGLEENHKNFIERLILGEDKEYKKAYLFEIINNKKNGIDVDKWDHLLRDGKQLNINITFDPHRLMKCMRIIEVKGKKHICFRDKERKTILHMYMMRSELHRTAYQHSLVKMVEEMLIDALQKADAEGYLFKGKKLSEVQKYPAAFACLTDHIFQDILCSEDGKCPEARSLLKRIHDRNLYKIISKYPLENEAAGNKFSEIKEFMRDHDGDAIKIEIKMEDLIKSVFIYSKENEDNAGKKGKEDWPFVHVFPTDITHLIRVEAFLFCKTCSSSNDYIQTLKKEADKYWKRLNSQ